MKKYVLRNGNDKLFIIRKGENLSDDDFSYTESGNDITITSYIGSDTDVKVVDKFKDMYMLVRPDPVIRLDITGYTYSYDEDKTNVSKITKVVNNIKNTKYILNNLNFLIISHLL